MVKPFAFGVIALMSSVLPARAQAVTSGPQDFMLKATIDWAQSFQGTFPMSDGIFVDPVVTAGWQFECRSGLQVTSQRVGQFSIVFRNVATHEFFFPPRNQIVTVARPDVAAAFTGQCPAVGAWVGFGIYSDPPPSGTWQVHIVWATSDGAGRWIQTDLYKTVIVP